MRIILITSSGNEIIVKSRNLFLKISKDLDIAKCLRTLAALPGDQGSVPSTHTTVTQPRLRGILSLIGQLINTLKIRITKPTSKTDTPYR